MLKRSEQSDLTHVCRHPSSGDSPEKRLNRRSFQSTLRLKSPYIKSFLRAISATMMSTDVSQIDVALFHSF